MSAGGKARNGAGVDDALALNQGHDKRELAEARLAKLATAKHADSSGLRTADNDLVLSLANVRNDKDFTYLRLKLRNTTTIDYAVDFTDFELVENSRKKFLGKKKNEARRPLAPAGGPKARPSRPGLRATCFTPCRCMRPPTGATLKSPCARSSGPGCWCSKSPAKSSTRRPPFNPFLSCPSTTCSRCILPATTPVPNRNRPPALLLPLLLPLRPAPR
ncbi:hypothetical protein [Hymenobacter sp. 102]|uniref:hypothetical protein n=1 Tax=Hymenobacter sp. 102 TaxID=3403152 RepID=UPI003CED37BE